jgi:hypothetical protein
MNGFIVRVLVALLMAGFLFVYARALRDHPHRRRAYVFGGAALLCFAAFNGILAAGGEIGPLQTILALAGLALFVGAVASLALSLRAGELRGERDRVAAAAREYRERRESAAENKEQRTKNKG